MSGGPLHGKATALAFFGGGLVLVGAVKMSDRVVREMMGL